MSLQSCRCPCFGHILFIWWNRQVKKKIFRKFFILNMMLSRRSRRWWLAWRREGGSGWMGLARLCTDLAVTAQSEYYCVTLWLSSLLVTEKVVVRVRQDSTGSLQLGSGGCTGCTYNLNCDPQQWSLWSSSRWVGPKRWMIFQKENELLSSLR